MDRTYYLFSKERMKKRARLFGIAGLACAFLFSSIPYLSIGLGSFAVLWAILSRGTDYKLSKEAEIGIYTGIGAILISVFMLSMVFFTLKNDTEYRESVIETIDSIYGDSYEEAYGESFSDTLNRFLGERSE